MPKSYRIKAQPNEDKNIFVNLEQDFDQLEILSLKTHYQLLNEPK